MALYVLVQFAQAAAMNGRAHLLRVLCLCVVPPAHQCCLAHSVMPPTWNNAKVLLCEEKFVPASVALRSSAVSVKSKAVMQQLLALNKAWPQIQAEGGVRPAAGHRAAVWWWWWCRLRQCMTRRVG